MPPRANLSISITLSSEQVDDVLRAASHSSASSLSSLISSALTAPAHEAAASNGRGGAAPALDTCDRRLSRSLLRGLAILSCFTLDEPDRGILDLARELDLSASTTHRYVLTLLEMGLLERCPRSRRYRLPRPTGGPQEPSAPTTANTSR